MLQRHAFVKDVELEPHTVQRERRERALDRQRASRTALFDLSRNLDDALDELDLGGLDEGFPTASPKQDKLSKAKTKWQRRYGDKLMFAETMTQLPDDLDEQWIALAVPKGKRCLVLTLGDTTRAQTLLLSRSKGRPLARRFTLLPPKTILDCIWDRDRSVLFVIDALEWNGLPLSGYDSEARRFWRDAKLAELGPQPVIDSDQGRRLIVASVPISESPRRFIESSLRGGLFVSVKTVQMHSSGEVDMDVDEHTYSIDMLTLSIELDGVLLYLREALYESGRTCLAGWLPLADDHLARVFSGSHIELGVLQRH